MSSNVQRYKTEAENYCIEKLKLIISVLLSATEIVLIDLNQKYILKCPDLSEIALPVVINYQISQR